MLDMIGGFRRRASSLAGSLPRVGRRRRGPNPAIFSVPAIAVAGLAAAAGVLLWDERRRATMRKRLDKVAGQVGSVGSSLNASARKVGAPTGVGGSDSD